MAVIVTMFKSNRTTMRIAAQTLSLFVIVVVASAAISHHVRASTRLTEYPKNVLLLMSDDMRPDIGAYGAKHMITPNLDRLASRSILLRHAYVQQAVCSPSRTSMLTGRRPDTTHVHDLYHYWRQVAGNFTTLPEYFKQHGYKTAGIGKIFHPGHASGDNDPVSWTEPYFRPDRSYWQKRSDKSWLSVNETEAEKYPLPDTQSAAAAVEQLKKFSESKTPFFLAVGFHKPHLPFQFPSRFLNLYPVESVKLPVNPYAPANMPEVAWSNFDELRKYSDINTQYGYGSINTTLPDPVVRMLRRAYFASISYVDSLIGQILDQLSALNLSSNTVVMFIGDHGWQLGEHGEWCKHTNFELATRTPMMLHVPGLTDSGLRSDALVEFVDIFPTVVEAAGLIVPMICPKDSRMVETCVEGVSFVPLLTANSSVPWKSAAFSQYPRMLVSGDVMMGYSMRTSRYRYTEWIFYDDVACEPLWDGGRLYPELYDRESDPDENNNVAEDQRYSAIRKQLHQQLMNCWRLASPSTSSRSSTTSYSGP